MSISFLDQINGQFLKGLPFVAYRKPDKNQVKVIFQKDQELHYVKDFNESGFVFAPFNGDNPAVLIKNETCFVETFEGNPTFSKSPENGLVDQDLDKEFYLKTIKKAINAIDSRAIDKVVLSRSIDVETSKTPFELFHDLLCRYPKVLCYIWFHPKIGLWLGASPEMLLETENDRFKTMSLAGTQLCTGEEVPDWGEKELEEQQMVTQYIQDSLADRVSFLEVSETTSVRAGNLWHIKTSVSGYMKNADLEGVIRALHPTPAVCGLPKTVAKAFILRNEKYKREFYTGFLGELNFKEEISRSPSRRNQENRAYRTIKNRTSLFVNLRCMQILENKVKVYVGGGITARSVPEKEWQETKDKSATMLNIILN